MTLEQFKRETSFVLSIEEFGQYKKFKGIKKIRKKDTLKLETMRIITYELELTDNTKHEINVQEEK